MPRAAALESVSSDWKHFFPPMQDFSYEHPAW